MEARLFALCGLIVAGVATRLLPETNNFTGVGAACLLSGAYLPRRSTAFIVPLAAYFVSDLVVNLQRFGGDTSQWVFAASTYLAFAATVAIGMALRGHTTPLRVGIAAIAASVLFFLVSNFAEWYSDRYNAYSHDLAGLVTCYVAGIPFARNMVVGNLFFSALLFGLWHYAAARYAPASQAEKAAQRVS